MSPGGGAESWVPRLRAHEALLRRAPSAHNTQPWALTWTDRELRVAVDPARALPDSDPTGRDLALGLGAFAEGALIVAAGEGLAVRVADAAGADAAGPGRPGSPWPGAGGCAEPVVRLVDADAPYRTPFTAADLAARRVARGRYHPGTVGDAVLAELGPGVAALPAMDLVRDLAVADRWLFGTPPVARELGEWLRLRPGHPRYTLDGLTDAALALSRIEADGLGLALRLLRAAPRLPGLPILLAGAGAGALRGAGSVLVLTAEPGEQAPDRSGVAPGTVRAGDGRIAAGRRLLRVWLGMARHGLAVHPLSQLIDCPTTAARLADRLGAVPLAVFRAGCPRHPPVRSARLPVSS